MNVLNFKLLYDALPMGYESGQPVGWDSVRFREICKPFLTYHIKTKVRSVCYIFFSLFLILLQ